MAPRRHARVGELNPAFTSGWGIWSRFVLSKTQVLKYYRKRGVGREYKTFAAR